MDRALQEFTFELMRHAAEQGLSKVTVTEGNFSITVENTPVEAAAVAPTAAAPGSGAGCGTGKCCAAGRRKLFRYGCLCATGWHILCGECTGGAADCFCRRYRDQGTDAVHHRGDEDNEHHREPV